MKAETLLSLPRGVRITHYAVSNGALHLMLTSTSLAASCPVCMTPSSAQHSCYQRMFRDAPCGGYLLRIVLRTRRFFCRQPDCARLVHRRCTGVIRRAASMAGRRARAGCWGVPPPAPPHQPGGLCLLCSPHPGRATPPHIFPDPFAAVRRISCLGARAAGEKSAAGGPSPG
jgi:hypothetical protein